MSSSTTTLAMAGLLSPKPVYHAQGNGQYGNYTRGLSTFSETPPLTVPSAQGHHMPPGGYGNTAIAHAMGLPEDGKIYSLVIELLDPGTREGALLELSKKREQYDDLALVLWHSFGEMQYQVAFIGLLMLPPRRKALCPLSFRRLSRCTPYSRLQTSPPMCQIVSATLWHCFNA